MELEEQNDMLEYNTAPPQPVGIYGWRKRCLYAFVLALMAVVIINLALTVWILRVLDFSLDGMGRLKITPKGFKLQGETEFLQPVYVNRLKSEEGQSLYLESNRAVELLTVDHSHKISSQIVVDHNTIKAKCDKFLVQDTKGNIKLLLSENDFVVGNGDATFRENITFNAAVCTPSLRGPDLEPLEIQSETNTTYIYGKEGVSVASSAGDVTVDAADNINIASRGAVHIKSEKIVLKGLPKVDPSTLPHSSPSVTKSPSPSSVYQLCLCENGRVFLGRPDGDCRSSSQICESFQP